MADGHKIVGLGLWLPLAFTEPSTITPIGSLH